MSYYTKTTSSKCKCLRQMDVSVMHMYRNPQYCIRYSLKMGERVMAGREVCNTVLAESLWVPRCSETRDDDSLRVTHSAGTFQ